MMGASTESLRPLLMVDRRYDEDAEVEDAEVEDVEDEDAEDGNVWDARRAVYINLDEEFA